MSYATVYQRPPLYKKQEDAFFNDKQFSFIEGSTKSGKTVSAISWLWEKALIEGKENSVYWWVAPVSNQADIAWRRMQAAIPHDDLYDKNENLKRLKIVNGAIIDFKSGDSPDSLYGEEVQAAVIDEASRVKRESWHSVRSTVTSSEGQIRCIGNVHGKSNWFYELCRVAEDGAPNMYYDKITAVDAAKAGVITWEAIEEARRMYPEAIFKELYLCEPSDEYGNPFGEDFIRAQILKDDKGQPTNQTAKGPAVAFGWDVAKATNYTVGIGLNVRGEVCEFHRWRDNWHNTTNRIMSITGTIPAFVDSTGVGDGLLEELHRTGKTNFRGFKFSKQSKQQLMELLAIHIQQGKIKYPDGRIVKELLAFEYEMRPSGDVLYSAPRGFNDDAVDSLALSVKMWSENRHIVDVEPIQMTRTSPWSI